MPSYISKDGIWTSKTEKVALIDRATGEPYIYEGPDRAAKEYMESQNVDHLGIEFHKDPQIILLARQWNMTVEEFCQMGINTDESRAAKFAEASKVKELHLPLKRNEPDKNIKGGGTDTANAANYMPGKLGPLPANVPVGLEKQALNK